MVTLKGNNGTYEGTSEDNKPLNVPVNTEFNELDTGKTYYFDGEEWQEEPPCEGGGFTPTSAQLAAMNSGITEEDVTQIGENENNILLVESENSSKNMLNYDVWKTNTVYHGTAIYSNNGVQLTANELGDCCTGWSSSTPSYLYPANAEISVSEGDTIVLLFDYTADSGQTNDKVAIFGNGEAVSGKFLLGDAIFKKLEFTIPPDVSFVTFRLGVQSANNTATYSNIMIMHKKYYTAGITTYTPYAMSNAELTAAIQAIQAQLANT